MAERYAYQGPERDVDRAVLLAHGAGADMRTAALTSLADALADAEIPSLRFDFPYKAAGRRAPDRPPVLAASARDAARELARRTKLPAERLVLGGRSMGGRICSMVVADEEDPLPALGLVLLGYPLHPPGKPESSRVEHFPRLHSPCLFVSGTRDSFGTPDELQRAARRIEGPVTWHWIESADHGFKPLKSSGLSVEQALAGAADAGVTFVRAL
jgi:uncharacterized protein